MSFEIAIALQMLRQHREHAPAEGLNTHGSSAALHAYLRITLCMTC
jgi:hypothetical protein